MFQSENGLLLQAEMRALDKSIAELPMEQRRRFSPPCGGCVSDFFTPRGSEYAPQLGPLPSRQMDAHGNERLLIPAREPVSDVRIDIHGDKHPIVPGA